MKFIKSLMLSLLCIAAALALPQTRGALAEDARFTESTDSIVEPEAGFYKAFSGYMRRNSDAPVIAEDSFLSYAGEYGIFHLRIDLADFSTNGGGRDAEIDDAALSSLEKTLTSLRSLKKGAIVRFSYNVTGATYTDADGRTRYLENEPPLWLIEKHIAALGGVISKYADVVLGVESGMLGPWGEQHSTALGSSAESNAHTYYAVVQTWLDSTPSSMGITVRRPRYFVYWLNERYGLELTVEDLGTFSCEEYPLAERVGFYDDGYLGSFSDLGTYSDREIETAFVGRQAEHTFFGGEVVADDLTDGMGEYNCVSFLEREAYITHTTYLNIDWNDSIIAEWKKSVYSGEDPLYSGKTSDFVFVGNHLGYRFVLRGAELPSSVTAGTSATFGMRVENVGFAPIIRKPKCEMVFVNGGAKVAVECAVDLTSVAAASDAEWEFGVDIPKQLAAGEWKVYLSVTAQSGGKIRFANPADYYDEDLGNYFGRVIVRAGYRDDNGSSSESASSGSGSSGGKRGCSGNAAGVSFALPLILALAACKRQLTP